MSFGQHIRTQRIKLKLSQKDLADKLFVTPQTISKWENDLSQPEFFLIHEMVKVFHTSYDNLFNGSINSPIEGVMYTAVKDKRMKKYYLGFIYFIAFLIIALSFTTAYLYTRELPFIFTGIHGFVIGLLMVYLIVLFHWKEQSDKQPHELFEIHPNIIRILKNHQDIKMNDILKFKAKTYNVSRGLRIFEETGMVSIELKNHQKIVLRDIVDVLDSQTIFHKITKED